MRRGMRAYVMTQPYVKNMAKLWTGIERWLLERYPRTERIVTPWMEPL